MPIPFQGEGIDKFLKGVDTGGQLFSHIMNARYNSSLHPSGDVANALYVQQLKNQYGENDPRYLQAKAAHDMAMAGHQSLMDYRVQLSNLAPYRAATPEERLVEAQRGRGVLQTFGPNGSGTNASNVNNQRIQKGMVSGEDGHTISEDEASVYNRALGKKTSDAAIRNKIPYAKNVQITLDSINPEDLVQYSGPEGTFKYGVDMLKSAVGTTPPEFMKYQTALTSAKTLAKQLRQFWGDSIQPTATDEIKKLTNPTYWNKNPQVALQQFNQLKQVTEQELGVFEAAGTSPLKLDYDKKTGGFFSVPKKDSNASAQNINTNNSQGYPSEGADDQILAVYGSELIKRNPKYTKDNLKHTAKINKISVKELIDQLLARGE